MDMQIFKKENSLRKKKDSQWRSLRLYWKMAVLFMFIVALGSAFFSYYFFRQISKDIIIEEGENLSPVRTIKKQRLEKALQYFSARKEKSTQILSSPAPIIDPSL